MIETPYRFYVFSDNNVRDCYKEFGDRQHPIQFIPFTYTVSTGFMAEEKYLYSYAAARFQELLKL
jgi:hypothetical protein